MKVKFGVIGANPEFRPNFVLQNFDRDKGELIALCDTDPAAFDVFAKLIRNWAESKPMLITMNFLPIRNWRPYLSLHRMCSMKKWQLPHWMQENMFILKNRLRFPWKAVTVFWKLLTATGKN